MKLRKKTENCRARFWLVSFDECCAQRISRFCADGKLLSRRAMPVASEILRRRIQQTETAQENWLSVLGSKKIIIFFWYYIFEQQILSNWASWNFKNANSARVITANLLSRAIMKNTSKIFFEKVDLELFWKVQTLDMSTREVMKQRRELHLMLFHTLLL